MMKYTNTLILLAFCLTTTAAVEDEKLPLRRLRQQTLHIPDLFEMSSEKNDKNEWYDASQNSMNRRRRNAANQELSEMDVFARLLQSDSSLSLSMPSGPTPVVPTPMVVPTPPAPVVAPVVPAPTITAPTPTAPVPVATSCPVYPVCASEGLTGECCPTVEGIFLDCCYGIVPVPVSSPVNAPSGPGTIEPAPVSAPTPTLPSAPVVSSCPVYPVCASLGLIGECCPTVEGIFLDCCSGIVPTPATSPVTAPSGPGTTEPAPTKSPKDGSMSKVDSPSSKSGSMSKVDSPSSKSGSMSSVESPSSKSGSMSKGESPSSKSGSMSSVESPASKSGSMSKGESPSSKSGSMSSVESPSSKSGSMSSSPSSKSGSMSSVDAPSSKSSMSSSKL